MATIKRFEDLDCWKISLELYNLAVRVSTMLQKFIACLQTTEIKGVRKKLNTIP